MKLAAAGQYLACLRDGLPGARLGEVVYVQDEPWSLSRGARVIAGQPHQPEARVRVRVPQQDEGRWSREYTDAAANLRRLFARRVAEKPDAEAD